MKVSKLDRVILHSDMNSFYASVECLYNPELKKVPMAVAGDVEQRHGIILAKNDLAKKCGVKTGEAIWQAKQKCPGLVTVGANYERYMQYSKAAHELYDRYTDQIEPFGMDECWLDVTGSTRLFGSGEQIAQEIRSRMKRELGLTVSVGVSWNKIFAKLGSDYKKPDAVTPITKENFKQIVWPLPASDLLYVGPATKRKLARYGIHTIGQLAEIDPDFMHRFLGKWGEYLWAFANGYDTSPVAFWGYVSPIKSIGNSMTTYRDMENMEDVWRVFTVLSESVAQRLREHGFRCKTIQISVRDKNLAWFERQAKLSTASCTSSEIARAAMDLFRANYSFNNPLRSIGVRACDLIDASSGVQIQLFEDPIRREKRENLESCMDTIRKRFGGRSVIRALLLNDNITQEHDPLTHDIHPVAYFR